MSLYNIRNGSSGSFTIAKFDDDLNFEVAYTVSADLTRCSCAAGPRPSCKHRKMAPRMQHQIGSGWFYNYETQKWHRPIGEEVEIGSANITATEVAALKAKPLEPSPAWQEAERQFLEPVLNKMLAVADAVGSEHHSPSRSYHLGKCYCDEAGERRQCDDAQCCIVERDTNLRDEPPTLAEPAKPATAVQGIRRRV